MFFIQYTTKANKNQVQVTKKEDIMENQTKEFYSCKEVAERYGVKEATVWKWCREGKIEAFRIGKIYRIRASELKRYEKERE